MKLIIILLYISISNAETIENLLFKDIYENKIIEKSGYNLIQKYNVNNNLYYKLKREKKIQKNYIFQKSEIISDKDYNFLDYVCFKDNFQDFLSKGGTINFEIEDLIDNKKEEYNLNNDNCLKLINYNKNNQNTTQIIEYMLKYFENI